jgi:hypothetical protein
MAAVLRLTRFLTRCRFHFAAKRYMWLLRMPALFSESPDVSQAKTSAYAQYLRL